MSDRRCQNVDRPDHTAPLAVPYMVGVYLGVNAIKDAYLLVEGPDCTYLKTEFIQGNHDLMACLTSVSGYHRITNTALHPSQMAASREDAIVAMLDRLAGNEFAKAVLLTSMPMAFITGADYDRLCRKVSAEHGKPVVNVPGKSLSHDWINGYAEVLKSLARKLPLERRSHSGPPRVGIVGYLFDRNEEDHLGNVREMTRLIKGLGADVSAVWLAGGGMADLEAIATSDLVVSLPYGRFAAQTVARKLAVPLLELDYPFGLEPTEEWVREIGSALGLETAAEALIDRELGRVIPKVEWIVPFLMQGKRYGYVGDPVLVFGFKRIVELLGGRLEFAVITNIGVNVSAPDQLGLGAEQLLADPTHGSLQEFMGGDRRMDVDLIVSNSMELPRSNRTPIMEFGFPSYFTHALYSRPFLGFDGFLAFVESIFNRLRWAEIEGHRPRGHGPS